MILVKIRMPAFSSNGFMGWLTYATSLANRQWKLEMRFLV